jgi:hypothetical protein
MPSFARVRHAGSGDCSTSRIISDFSVAGAPSMATMGQKSSLPQPAILVSYRPELKLTRRKGCSKSSRE